MTSTRAYRQALSLESANTEIIRCSETQFDPDIVPVFLSVQGKIEIPVELTDMVMPEGNVDAIFARQA